MSPTNISSSSTSMSCISSGMIMTMSLLSGACKAIGPLFPCLMPGPRSPLYSESSTIQRKRLSCTSLTNCQHAQWFQSSPAKGALTGSVLWFSQLLYDMTHTRLSDSWLNYAYLFSEVFSIAVPFNVWVLTQRVPQWRIPYVVLFGRTPCI